MYYMERLHYSMSYIILLTESTSLETNFTPSIKNLTNVTKLLSFNNS